MFNRNIDRPQPRNHIRTSRQLGLVALTLTGALLVGCRRNGEEAEYADFAAVPGTTTTETALLNEYSFEVVDTCMSLNEGEVPVGVHRPNDGLACKGRIILRDNSGQILYLNILRSPKKEGQIPGTTGEENIIPASRYIYEIIAPDSSVGALGAAAYAFGSDMAVTNTAGQTVLLNMDVTSSQNALSMESQPAQAQGLPADAQTALAPQRTEPDSGGVQQVEPSSQSGPERDVCYDSDNDGTTHEIGTSYEGQDGVVYTCSAAFSRADGTQVSMFKDSNGNSIFVHTDSEGSLIEAGYGNYNAEADQIIPQQ